MTFRRSVLLRHPFDPSIQYLHDETEMWLRARADGIMVQCFEPLIFHAQAVGLLVPRRGAKFRARWLLGHAYMFRKLMADALAADRFVRRYVSRTEMLDLLQGLVSRDLAMWKGERAARDGIHSILSAPKDQIAEVFKTRCWELRISGLRCESA